MLDSNGSLRRIGVALVGGCIASLGFVGTAVAQSDPATNLVFATSEIAQVMLSIGAVSFVVLAARAYGGEIGRALLVVGGGVVLFAVWQLMHGASQLLALRPPPSTAGSVVNLAVTILLLAGFYMLYETTTGLPDS